MSPPPFRLMIMELASRPALWTFPLDHLVMSEKNVDFAVFQLQLY